MEVEFENDENAMAAREGFEPSFSDSNSDVLPIRRPGTIQRIVHPRVTIIAVETLCADWS